MGMTIEESIENLVLLKKLEDSLGNISGNTNSVASQSLRCAIDTMRKYQKIEELVNHRESYLRGEIMGFRTKHYMRMIKEVLEDGIND